MTETNRYYFKCTFCERPFTLDYTDGSEITMVLNGPCPLCNELGTVRRMGRVEKTNIVRSTVKSACDLRCTNAVGPKCDCLCQNENHGTHKLVVYNRIVGKLEVVNKDLLNDNENYLARIKRMAEAKNRIKVKVIAVLEYKLKDILEFVKKNSSWQLKGDDYYKYQNYRARLRQIDKIEDYKSIQRKVNELAHMLPKLGATNLEILAAIYEKKQEKIAA